MKQILLLTMLFLAACTTGNVVVEPSGDAQEVHVSVVGPEYIFSPSVVEANKPVRLIFDSAPPGCARSFTIPSEGIAQIVTAGSTIEFTPQSSVVNVACSMNMYKGKLLVK